MDLIYKPETVNIMFPRGDTYIFRLQLKDKNGTLLALTGEDRLTMTVKKPKGGVVVKQLTVGEGIEAGGDFYIFTLNNTDQLEITEYKYDIEYRSNSRVTTLVLGMLILTDEVTFTGDLN